MTFRIAALLLVFAAGATQAQTQPAPGALNLQLPPLPAQNDIVDKADAATTNGDDLARSNGVTVHGSFTSGIGYSDAYGHGTFNSAELNVSKQYGDGKTVDLHLDATRTTGMPIDPMGYGVRYPYSGY